jgi:enterobactin synthetase component D
MLPIRADRLPQWPVGWIGSISHCRVDAIVVAATCSRWYALEVDRECLLDTSRASGIGAQIASASDARLLASLSLLLPLSSLYQTSLQFSAKEALYKALFPRVRRFQDCHAVRVIALAGHLLRLHLNHAWPDEWPTGCEIDIAYVLYARQV